MIQIENINSPINVSIQIIERQNGEKYLSTEYNGRQCPFCGSQNYGGGGSWSPDGCLDCGAVNFMGWVKEIGKEYNESNT